MRLTGNQACSMLASIERSAGFCQAWGNVFVPSHNVTGCITCTALLLTALGGFMSGEVALVADGRAELEHGDF
jgi:hypothetical protein